MVTIYIYLLDEGTDVWRPVLAEPLGNDLYRIASDSTAPEFETEAWEFQTGDRVRCEDKVFSGGAKGLVAVEKVTPPK